MSDLLKPEDIGLPPKFTSWRPGQWEAVEAGLYSEKRFVICCAPTGFGKSLVYLAQAKAAGVRTIILTSTKGLQDQLISDFGAVGLVDVRGMNNYECLDVYLPGRKVRCDEGPCHAGYRCALKSGGCLYYDAVRKAKESTLVVTNYAYWMTARQVGIELGEVDLLVLDEAHDAPDELSSFLHVEIQAHEAEGVLGTRFPEVSAEVDTVKDWAAYHGRIVRERLEAIKQGMQEGHGPKNAVYEAKVLRDLGRKLDFLSKMRGEWVMERHERSMHWDPVWPGEYAESYLFGGVKRIVLVSATVRPKTAHLLNIPAGEWEFDEYASSFPASARPVIHVPTVRMNRKTPPDQIKTWLARIDQLIGKRLDRKGIVHTVSYRRRNEIMAASEYKSIMVSHESRNTAAAVHNFKSMDPPAVMVSPSLGTGWDFPHCLDPASRILTSDLRWVEIGDLRPQDSLVGFDEESDGGGHARQWRKCSVAGVRRMQMPSYRMQFDNGTEVICSANHRWLVASGAHFGWLETWRMRDVAHTRQYPTKVIQVADLWEARQDWQAGYLAGAFDGEGCLYIGKRTGKSHRAVINLAFYQRDNAMLHEVENLLRSSGYWFTHKVRRPKSPKHQDGHNLQLFRIRNILKFMGEVRPPRLQTKMDIEGLGLMHGEPTTLLNKEEAGRRELVDIETSTRTLVVEGLASHNSECRYMIVGKLPYPDVSTAVMKARTREDAEYTSYLTAQALVQMAGRGMRAEDDWCEVLVCDDNFCWFVRKYRDFLPKWFLESVRWARMNPDPLGVPQ